MSVVESCWLVVLQGLMDQMKHLGMSHHHQVRLRVLTKPRIRSSCSGVAAFKKSPDNDNSA